MTLIWQTFRTPDLAATWLRTSRDSRKYIRWSGDTWRLAL